jgi:hypothetical protein
MKLQLPNVTLFCLDCEKVNRAIRVLEHCRSLCDFGAIQYMTSLTPTYPHTPIPEIRGRDGNRTEGLVLYSEFMLRESYRHIQTSHFLTVQHDGWVLHPDRWDPAWLEYDYIGPLYVQYPKVGSGGFSLRSRRIMELVSTMAPAYTPGRMWEDGVISLDLRHALENKGCRFPAPEVAAQFAYGGNAHAYQSKPFGFHGFYALDTLLGGTGADIARNPDLQLRKPDEE